MNQHLPIPTTCLQQGSQEQKDWSRRYTRVIYAKSKGVHQQ